jgi:type II secretory pathway component PulF
VSSLTAPGGSVSSPSASAAAERIRVHADRLLLRVPILGTLIEQAAIAGWARLFSILYSSRTDPIKAVELAAETLTNAELRDRFMRVADAQTLGRDIAAQMRVVGIPAVAAKMLQVGTESSRVAEMMNELAEYYEEETDYTVDKLTSRMEPIAVVVVMVPVGTLVSGVYLMMTQSMRAIGAG